MMSDNQTNNNSPTKNPLEKIVSFGSWAYNNNQEIVWRTKKTLRRYSTIFGNWEDIEETTTEQKPEDIGLVRSANINILYLKEIESLDTLEGKRRIWFRIPVLVRINPNMENNLWLKHSDGRLFLINCDPDLPQAIEIGFQNSENYSIKEGHAVKLTLKQAQELAKTTHYCFSRKINGEYVTVVSAV